MAAILDMEDWIDPWEYFTLFDHFEAPTFITNNELNDRVVLVTTIPPTHWEIKLQVYRTFQFWWQRMDLTEWEMNRQRSLMLEIMRQMLGLCMGIPTKNPVHPTQLYATGIKVVSWNCIGAGDEYFLRNFRKYVLIHKPTLVIITETLVTNEVAWGIVPFLGYTSYRVTPANGMVGGLWFLWNHLELDVEITDAYDHGIDAIIRPRIIERLTSTVVHPLPRKPAKTTVFDYYSSDAQILPKPFLVIGKFNEVASTRATFGSSATPSECMENETLRIMELHDAF